MHLHSNETSELWSGQTFVETIALIGVLVLTAGMAYQIFAADQGLSRRQAARQTAGNALLAFSDQAPVLLLRVAPPAWFDPDAVISTTGLVMKLGGVDGDPARTLVLDSPRPGWLRAQVDGEQSVEWGPFEAAEWASWMSKARRVGTIAKLVVNGETLTLHLPWGGSTL